MNIVVLNGSPKGDQSVTMQYVHFIQRKFPQHELKIWNVAQRIRAIENNEDVFRQLINEITSADGILWAFPIYFLLVHSHYKRFIELIWERGAEDAYRNTYAAALSTSIHFYDHTAHNYVNAVCDDLGMKYVGSFSADMYDLMSEQERTRLLAFAGHFFQAIDGCIATTKTYQPLVHKSSAYRPGDAKSRVDIGNLRITILTDGGGDDTNLARMIRRFRGAFSSEVELIDLGDVDIKGGCLGCLQCAYDNACSYGDSDGYVRFFNTNVRTADVLVIAGAVKDRYLSSRWKAFFDRSFFNTHIPVLAGKQIGLILSGPLRHIPNLRQVLEGYFEVHEANVVDFVTDEYEDSAHIDDLLQSLAERLIRFAGEGYRKPSTFLGVGGHKIFRDDIYGRLRFPFRADHRFYRAHGVYDFPQKEIGTRMKNALLMLLTRIPSMRNEIYTRRLKTEMIKPLAKIVETK